MENFNLPCPSSLALGNTAAVTTRHPSRLTFAPPPYLLRYPDRPYLQAQEGLRILVANRLPVASPQLRSDTPETITPVPLEDFARHSRDLTDLELHRFEQLTPGVIELFAQDSPNELDGVRARAHTMAEANGPL